MCDVGGILTFMMLICNYLPGGRLAGQVSLADSKEFEMQQRMSKVGGDESWKKLGKWGVCLSKQCI